MTPQTHAGELGAQGAKEWRRRIQQCVSDAARQSPSSSFGGSPDPRLSERTTVDWNAFPQRAATCLTRRQALELLDLDGPIVGAGGRALQEEYVEWRVVRNDQAIASVEFTTETSDYWRVLAAYRPDRLLDLVKEIANVDPPDVTQLYGDFNPFEPRATPADREEAFAETTLWAGTSQYNNGELGICCMVHPSNSLAALTSLAVASTTARVIEDESHDRLRSLTCTEAIPLLGDAAQFGRNSDPLLVERLSRLACEGRMVSLANPMGPYISGIQHTRLRRPDGSPVPPEWFVCSRAVSLQQEGPGLGYQRMKLQVPKGEDLCVSDLIDLATEEPIHSGAQVADLVQVGVIFHVSPAQTITIDPGTPIEPQPIREDPNDCRGLHLQATELRLDGESV